MINVKALALKKKIPDITGLDFQVHEGECVVLLSAGERTFHHLFNIFCGLERDFKGTVEVDGADIAAAKRSWVCLAPCRQWPGDMKVGSLLRFFIKGMNMPREASEELAITLNFDELSRKKIAAITEEEWRRVLFALVRSMPYKNYIIRDLARGMSLEFKLEAIRRVQEIKNRGGSVLYLSDDVFLAPEIGDRVCFLKKGRLLLELEASRMTRMNLQELYFKFLAERQGS